MDQKWKIHYMLMEVCEVDMKDWLEMKGFWLWY